MVNEIEFDDIRVGDKIRRTCVITKDEYSKTVINEGIAAQKGDEPDFWVDKAGNLLATPNSDLIELLERPIPKVPTKYLSVVQHKERPELYVMVRVKEDNNSYPWIGNKDLYEIRRWFQDHEVQALLDSGDWEVVTNEDH